MSCIVWNARGLGNQRAFRELKRLVAEKNPSLLFLSETKLRDNQCQWWKNVLGFSGMFIVNCLGRSGGLMLMWKEPFGVRIMSYTMGHIDCTVRHSEKFWRFTGFYGNPESNKRYLSWDLLLRLHGMPEYSGIPWIVGGDFNEVCYDTEKIGGNIRPLHQTQAFRDTLIHVPFKTCMEVPHSFNPHKSTFRFETHWATEDECSDVIARGWCTLDASIMLSDRISQCKKALMAWAGDRFRCLPRQIKQKRDILNSLKTHDKWQDSAIDIQRLEKEVELLSSNEEIYWKQRSKANWMAYGDQNSKYFHACASRRRARNLISGLVSSHRDWCTDKSSMAEIVLDYFSNLFMSTNPSSHVTSQAIEHIVPKLNEDMNATLCAKFSTEEVRKALFDMHPDKALGPDGMSAFFFQK
ncbi:uncharacterized protein LOC142530656 [Primulina tabacum]|uniref:uncharacterized protein LOC142530656 n=1 Tax=Primulina tabacum TaxID=48773 RepID=UPI003F5A6F21